MCFRLRAGRASGHDRARNIRARRDQAISGRERDGFREREQHPASDLVAAGRERPEDHEGCERRDAKPDRISFPGCERRSRDAWHRCFRVDLRDRTSWGGAGRYAVASNLRGRRPLPRRPRSVRLADPIELRQRRCAAADPQLVEHVLEVLADGGRLDPQLPRDLGVGEAILHASHHIAFPGGQRRDARRPFAEEQG